MNRATRISVCILCAAVAGALLFRLPRLNERPMHPDEAVQAAKTCRLYETGDYRYDPHEHHGPSLYYLALPSVRIVGKGNVEEADDTTFRLVPVLFGAGLVLLVGLMWDGLGRAAALVAALFTAISPAMVYYSRYYIQETLLVFFTFLALAAGWRYVRSRSVWWALVAGAAVGLMHATKETWILSVGAMLVALGLTVVWSRRTGQEEAPAAPARGVPPTRTRRAIVGWHLAGAVAVAAIVSAIFYSSFFKHPAGVLDSFRAYVTYLTRGGGDSIHVHPWHYYLGVLALAKDGAWGGWSDLPSVLCDAGPIWTEGLILALAAVGVVAAVTRKGASGASAGLLRFLAIYTVVLTAVYSVIPYKTPWCALGFLHGMILLAGVGAVALVRWLRCLPLQALGCAVLAVGTVHLGWEAHRTAFRLHSDWRNPYAYAQTYPSMFRLIERVEDLAKVHPDGHRMLVKVISPENYWPVPWYLRQFERVGYWDAPPADADAPVIIASAEIAETLDRRLRNQYQEALFGLRPGAFLVLYVQKDLWKAYLARPAASAGTQGDATLAEPKALSVAARRSRPAGRIHRLSHRAMGTSFDIFVAGRELSYAQAAAEEAFGELDRLEQELSRFNPASDVSQINRLARGQSVAVGHATIECLRTAARIHAETGGAFDATIGRLTACWKTRSGGARTPTGDDLDPFWGDALSRTGMNLLEIDESRHAVGVKADGVRIDLGGIGKGYALEQMAAILRDWDIESALVSSGGSTVLALGVPTSSDSPAAGRRGWKVSLGDASAPVGIIGSVRIRGRALSGSAAPPDDRHIIDPRTGRPVTDKLGAWAAAPSAAVADALSTAFMVMSPDEVEAYCKKHRDVSAILTTVEPGGRHVHQFGKWEAWQKGGRR